MGLMSLYFAATADKIPSCHADAISPSMSEAPPRLRKETGISKTPNNANNQDTPVLDKTPSTLLILIKEE